MSDKINMRWLRRRQLIAFRWFIKILLVAVLLLGHRHHQQAEGAHFNKDTPDIHFVEIGTDVTLTCESGATNVLWQHNGRNITKEDGRYAIEKSPTTIDDVEATGGDTAATSGPTLTIHTVQLTDEGNVTCNGSSPDGDSAPALQRRYEIRPFVLPKVVASTSVKVKQRFKHPQTLYCTFEVYPHNETMYSQLQWLKDEKKDVDFLKRYTTVTPLNTTHLNLTLELTEVYKKENGSYACVAYDAAADGSFELARRGIDLLVMEMPDVSIDFAKAVGARQIYLNWTVNDGNDPIEKYFVQTAKNGSSEFSYYQDRINGKNTSFVLENLDPNTIYNLRISAKNSIGTGMVRPYEHPVRTLDRDPEFIPKVGTTGSTSSTITIGWSPPPAELLQYVHYYELVVSQNGNIIEKTTHQQNSRNLPYMFDHLKTATEYEFKVRACSDLTHKCGNWSEVVNGTTMDGSASKPTDLRVMCLAHNITKLNSVVVSWNYPEHPNGKVMSYQILLKGESTYMMDGRRHKDELQQKMKWIDEPQHKTVYEGVPPNTNCTVTVSAVTRHKKIGEAASATCTMPVAVPEFHNRPMWTKVKPNSKCLFKVVLPRMSERNGPICCYRVYLVRMGSNYRGELPPPEKLNISTYHDVHSPNNTVGGAYIAEMFAGNRFHQELYLGDGKRYFENEGLRSEDVDQECRACLNGEPFLKTFTPEFQPPPPSTNFTQANTELTQREHLKKSGNLPMEHSKILENKKRRRRYPFELRQALHSVPEELAAMHVNGPRSEIGAAANVEEVFDGEIDMNSNYTGFVEVIMRDNSAVMTTYSNYFDMITPGTLAEQYPGSDNISLILNIFIEVLIVLIGIVIVLLVVLWMMHRYNVRHSVPGDEVIGLRDSLRRLFGGRSTNHRHFLGASNAKTSDMGPIHKNDMYLAYTNRHKDTDYGFLREYEMLPNRFSDRTTKNSDMKENAMKNRYPDIKAYDQTRVKLSQVNGIQGSDYINANFVIGYKERKKFICAQGPMESTINDFWRMIWEQHLEIIVMLTNLEEYNKSKCAKYWPEKISDMKQFGDITVKFVAEKKMGDYLTRNLDIYKRNASMNDEEEERRQITQYHYLVWKDFMAPEHPHGIIKFIRHINAVYSVQRGPILVHCSAGVGRTGTLVALDSLMQQLEEEDQVAIFNTVSDLRHQRNFLVQSLKQYIFLYRALLDTAHFGNTELNASYLSAAIENLKLKGADGKDKCKLEIEFEKLLSVQDETNKSCAVGTNEENAQKNRSELIIPYDRNRVILSPIPMKENSTYINASFIEGYENSETFIITQDPMENTIADLWRMISEQSICTVVIISEIGEGPRKCPRYWADDEIQYDHIQVKYMQSESCPYYTRREFNVTNCKIDDTIRVTQFQYNGWPTVDGEVPEVCRGIIELVDQALNHHNKEKNIGCRSPIAVHCSLGTDRSSIFVAMCILVQQLRTEKCIDICSVARKIRSQRQGLLNTYAQYEFLHRAIANYADLHKLSVESSPSN